jgi:hypothetical protein
MKVVESRMHSLKKAIMDVILIRVVCLLIILLHVYNNFDEFDK